MMKKIIIIIAPTIAIIALAIFILNFYILNEPEHFFREASGRASINAEVTYLDNEFFSSNIVPSYYNFLLSFTDFIEVDSRFSAGFSEDVEAFYNYTATQFFVIRYRGTVNGEVDPILYQRSTILHENSGSVFDNNFSIPTHTYTIFPKEYVDVYFDFMKTQTAKMESENVTALNARGFSAEIIIEFVYDISVPDWSLNESTVSGYRFAISSEVYNFMEIGSGTFAFFEDLSPLPREASLPLIIVFVMAFAIYAYSLFRSIKGLMTEQQEIVEILRKYADEIVISNNSALKAGFIPLEVTSFEELLKLAISSNTHIVHYHDENTAEFVVIIHDCAYHYTTTEQKPVSN